MELNAAPTRLPHRLALVALTVLSALPTACGPSVSTPPPHMQSETTSAASAPPSPAPPGMSWIPGGTYLMGSTDQPHESPVHKATVEGFWLDTTEVTHAQFTAFITATGYLTTAEKTPRREDFPPDIASAIPPEKLQPGANNFRPTTGPVPLTNEFAWWEYKIGASWRQPTGPTGPPPHPDQPVVCVSWHDATAYCAWARKRLPTEAEWEHAARAGHSQRPYIWGHSLTPEGRWLMNIWQGDFPHRNTAADGSPGLAPVRSYPPNDYGLYDMAGNVWEWCQDYYAPDYYHTAPTYRPVNETPDTQNREAMPCRIMKGGSWLCNDCYCLGYRPAGRQYSTPDTSADHCGFRAARSP